MYAVILDCYESTIERGKNMYRILVCEDEKSIADALEIYLVNEEYEVLRAENGIEALEIIKKEELHLILMDIMMPKMDGIKATMRIREEKNIPIIILSAKGEDYDKVLGLNVGADDYVTKPFNPLELLARVKSQLRRYTNLGGIAEKTTDNMVRTGGLEIDLSTHEVFVDGEQKKLTPVEFGILSFLAQNAGRVYSIHQIYEAVWNEPSVNTENTVSVHIRRIREKIEINAKEPKYVKVVWGVGYKVEKI